MTALLEFERVSLQQPVGQGFLLDELSFAVMSGAFVGLVGPSGAGKTSLLRLVNRLVDPSAGRILWEGEEVRSQPVIAYRRQVTLVLQESRLLGQTVAQTLSYPLRLRGQSVTPALLDPWLTRCKIPASWLGKTAVELSVGQLQRVALARALVAQPRLLLLDEPTASQDVGYANQLLTELAELTRSQELTVIMANHQLEWVEAVATQVLFLEQGKLRADLPVQQVDWPGLRQAIITANHQATADWDEEV